MGYNKLEKSYIDFCTLTNFLISLFYETDCKYSCSRTKIGKLLSILAFKYAINGEKLFVEPICKYDGCGTAIRAIIGMLGRDVYPLDSFCDDKKYIKKHLKGSVEVNHPSFTKMYQQSTSSFFKMEIDLPKTVMDDTIDVFRNFGAYSTSDLSDVLNPIVEKLTDVSCGPIDLSKVFSVIDEVDQDNEVVKYLKSHKKDNNVEKNKTMIKKY